MATVNSGQPFDRVWVYSQFGGRTIGHILSAIVDSCSRLGLSMAAHPRLADCESEGGNERARRDFGDYPHIAEDELEAWKPSLIIAIGGDGGMLSLAPWAGKHGVPVLGINLGKLGFLVDVNPKGLEVLDEILSGCYIRESRHMLECRDQHGSRVALALNEVSLIRGHGLKMLVFDVLVDGQLVCQQRSDGLVIATPTGSTAYSLSAGGPILHPSMNAVTIVPLCPHRLSSRPIVVPAASTVEVYLYPQCRDEARINCDGHIDEAFPGDKIQVTSSQYSVDVIHPSTYQFYDMLRTKLHWEVNPDANQCDY